ncbi:MAG: hypothetical protein IT376_05065 [Polyangiaceae bacterium]|nr:hypothetical protein [Polyangiaceae bacterium]
MQRRIVRSVFASLVLGLGGISLASRAAASGPAVAIRSRLQEVGRSRTATTAVVELEWPLGRDQGAPEGRPFMAPRQARSQVPPAAPVDEASPPPPEPPPSSRTGPGRPAILVTPRLARAALRAASRAAGAGESWARLADLAGRARSSALLPELRLAGGRTTDEALRFAPTVDDPGRYTATGEARLFFEARLAWRLDRLVFADEELGVERLRGAWLAARAALARQVLGALVAWQRAALRVADADLDDASRAEALVDAVEAEITLDLLTGGWFSRNVRSVTAGTQTHPGPGAHAAVPGPAARCARGGAGAEWSGLVARRAASRLLGGSCVRPMCA